MLWFVEHLKKQRCKIFVVVNKGMILETAMLNTTKKNLFHENEQFIEAESNYVQFIYLKVQRLRSSTNYLLNLKVQFSAEDIKGVAKRKTYCRK